MKSLIFMFSLLLALVFVTACGGSHESSSTPVTLDNGKRWIANPETTSGINNMRGQIGRFTGHEDVDAYAQLKVRLVDEYNLIFKNCTMKGEAHEQLHNYLVPMNKMFEGLASTDLNTCKESFKAINTHLDSYTTYFE